jgi:hypothetical protein
MLDRFERDDRIETGVGEGEFRHGPVNEFEIRERIPFAGVRNRVGGNVDSRYAGGSAREQKTAITFSAGGVEHAKTADERRDEGVAMQVLVPDRAAHLGRESLAGEGQRGGEEPVQVGAGGQKGPRMRRQPRTTLNCSRLRRRPGAAGGDPDQPSVSTTGW